MSAMNVDRSLDDIISEKPRTGGGRRRGGGGRRGGGAGGAGSNARQRYSGTAPASGGAAKSKNPPPPPGEHKKIMVSNLPPDVNEQQIKELFTSTIGGVADVTLHYDAKGKSKGAALVTFKRDGDGTRAYNDYNNRLIDQRRPMKVEIIVDPSHVPPKSLKDRVAPAPAPAVGGALAAANAVGGQGSGGQRRSRGGAGRRRGGGGGSRAPRPQKSAADLDAEMEDYAAAGVSATAAPAA